MRTGCTSVSDKCIFAEGKGAAGGTRRFFRNGREVAEVQDPLVGVKGRFLPSSNIPSDFARVGPEASSNFFVERLRSGSIPTFFSL